MRPNQGLIVFLFLFLLVLTPLLYLKKQFSKEYSNHPRIPVTLYARAEGRIYSTDLEEYLAGVVAAEMPAEFSIEALKAQAVAARTLAIRRLKRYGGKGCLHYSGVDFCDDPSENQAWLSVASLIRKWGQTGFQRYYRKIKQAVSETNGIIITYHNRPIDAVFHSTCGVGTAAASEIWHNEIPYLQRESCGFDLRSFHYRQQYFFTWLQMAQHLGISQKAARQIRAMVTAPEGRILKISMGNIQMDNEEFRRKLALQASYFYWKTGSKGINVTTVGYGHGVGLCQYGADGMAKQGWNYQMILRHYYRGIRFCKITS